MEHNNAKESPPDAQRFGPTRDSILAPAGDSGKLDLAEVIDVPAIQSLMDDFHRLTHLKMSSPPNSQCAKQLAKIMSAKPEKECTPLILHSL